MRVPLPLKVGRRSFVRVAFNFFPVHAKTKDSPTDEGGFFVNSNCEPTVLNLMVSTFLQSEQELRFGMSIAVVALHPPFF